jgi:ribosomal-protein-alanine N-acetyltransferase
LLEGKNVNLRIVEKEDLPLFAEWVNNPDFYGEYNPQEQRTRTKIEKNYEDAPPEERKFFIEKKDGTRIGIINHFLEGELLEIGFTIIPSERDKGYCSEALMIMVDYLFLSRDRVRLQAHTDTRNLASQRVLKKAGFEKEGVVRKSMFIRGEWRDLLLYSILREEWKEPKTLARTEKK